MASDIVGVRESLHEGVRWPFQVTCFARDGGVADMFCFVVTNTKAIRRGHRIAVMENEMDEDGQKPKGESLPHRLITFA